jgi:hypothetical protein
MLAPLCALGLFGLILVRGDSLNQIIAGPAVVLATSTGVGPGTVSAPVVVQPTPLSPTSSEPAASAPTASPSALVSDAVSEPIAESTLPPSTVIATALAPTLTAAPTINVNPEATVVPTLPDQPTATTAVNVTAAPASPTPFGAATGTAPAPTATTPAGGATPTVGPEGWEFRGINVLEVMIGNSKELSLLAEIVNTSAQDQNITGIQATIKLTDGSSREFAGDDVYWPTRDAEFDSGLAPNTRMPIEITINNIGDGVGVAEITWRVVANAGGSIGRKDLVTEMITTSERNGQLCAYYRLTVPPPALTQGVVVSFWAFDEAGKIVGLDHDFGNLASGQKTICVPVLSGEVVHTTSLAVWGQ